MSQMMMRSDPLDRAPLLLLLQQSVRTEIDLSRRCRYCRRCSFYLPHVLISDWPSTVFAHLLKWNGLMELDLERGFSRYS